MSEKDNTNNIAVYLGHTYLGDITGFKLERGADGFMPLLRMFRAPYPGNFDREEVK